MNEGLKSSSHAVTLRKRASVLPSPPSLSSPNQEQQSLSSSSGALSFSFRGEVEVGNKLQVVTRSIAARAAVVLLDRVLLVSLWTPINAYGRLYRLSQSLFATDIIYRYLALAPVPYLLHAFSVFQFIWSSVQQAQSSKRQLESISQSTAQLLCMLDGDYGAKRLL